jgi:hypothetical protein
VSNRILFIGSPVLQRSAVATRIAIRNDNRKMMVLKRPPSKLGSNINSSGRRPVDGNASSQTDLIGLFAASPVPPPITRQFKQLNLLLPWIHTKCST